MTSLVLNSTVYILPLFSTIQDRIYSLHIFISEENASFLSVRCWSGLAGLTPLYPDTGDCIQTASQPWALAFANSRTVPVPSWELFG